MSREPWKKRRADGDKFHVVEDGIWIATVHGENADVVTASRDLLEVCEVLVEDIRKHAHGMAALGHVDHIRQAHAAIAKARGNPGRAP